MIKSSDIQTSVTYDKPYVGAVVVKAHFEAHEVITIGKYYPEHDRERVIDREKERAKHRILNRINDFGALIPLVRDLEYIALMSSQGYADRERILEIRRQIDEILANGGEKTL